MDGTEIRDIGRASVLVRRYVNESREHGCHCVVHPDVDRAELAFAALRCRLYLIVLGDVRLNDDRSPAERLDLTARLLEPPEAARDKAHLCSAPAEGVRHGTANACRCTSDDDDLPAHRA